MNVYTWGIVSLPGGIKEFHEGNGICTRDFLQEEIEEGLCQSRGNSKSTKIVQRLYKV